MKLFQYIILILLLCNIPGIVLFNFGEGAGSLFSYITVGLLLVFYLLNNKHRLPWPFVFFALTYFIIAGLIYTPDEKYYFFDFIKYVIVIVCGAELARRTTILELYILLLIGAASILVNALFFPMDYGRYSGFFLDPNAAGFICLLGVALAFAIKSEKWKYIGILIFTFCGVLTFSRTFFFVWIVIILISVFQNRSNIKIFVGGIAAVLLLLTIANSLKLDTERLTILDSLFSSGKVSQNIDEGSRTETWAKYYDIIYDSPLLGNGYKAFKSDNIYDVGVHNNYLRIIGDAGILPFLIFVGIYVFIFIKSLKSYKTKPYELLLAITLITINLTNHNFDTIHHVTFVSIWLYLRIISPETEDINVDDENME